MVKATEEELLIRLKDFLERQIDKDMEKDITVQFDFDPVNPY